MNYRPLGRTGIQVSQLCLGTMLYGSRTPEAEAIDQVDAALEAGINFLDTANVYGRGRSEEIVGKALARDGKRQRVILATKVNVRMHDHDPNAWGNHRRHIMEQCHESLRRLQTDYIDLYYLHRPQADVAIDETLRALDDLIHQGKIHYVACSTFAAWAVVEALWASDRLHLHRFVAEQPPYHLLERTIENELLPMAETYDLAIMPWSPLAGGLLTGRYTRQSIPTEGRLKPGNEWNDRHFKPEVFDAVEVLQAIAVSKGCSLTQFAIAWLMAQPNVTSPIIGAGNQAQLDELLGSLNVHITDEDRQQVDAICPPGQAIVPYYRVDSYTDFRPHPYRW